jgi:hypothetical protein
VAAASAVTVGLLTRLGTCHAAGWGFGPSVVLSLKRYIQFIRLARQHAVVRPRFAHPTSL